MDRRIFLTGLVGVTAAATLGAALPRPANALDTFSKPIPPPEPESLLPNLSEPDVDMAEFGDDWEFDDEEESGFQLADHRRRHRRRRLRRWRRVCRRWRHNGHWHSRCRRRPYWVWGWYWI